MWGQQGGWESPEKTQKRRQMVDTAIWWAKTSSKMVARKEGRVGTSLLGRTSLGTSKAVVARIGFSGGAGEHMGALDHWKAEEQITTELRL